MCVITPAVLASMAAMVGGAVIQGRAQSKAAKRQKAAITEGMRRQSKVLDDKRALTLDNLEQYRPEQRMIAQEAAATEAEEGLVGELIRAKDAGISIPESNGDVSNQYKTNLARAAVDEMDRASVMASLMSRFRAPTDMRFEEGIDNANFASQQGGLDARGRSMAATDDFLIQQAGKPDPRKMMLGSLMQSIGSAYMGGTITKGLGATGGAAGGGASTMMSTNPSGHYAQMFLKG